MVNKTFWISFVFSIIGFINIILYAMLSFFKIFNYGNIVYLFLMLYFFIVWIPFLLHIFFKIEFSIKILIFYQIFMFLADVIGSVWRVYDYSNLYDKFMHFLSGVLFAILIFNSLKNNKNNKLNLFWIFLFVFSFSMMIGAFWEILEFGFDGILGRNAQHWQNLTGREILYDTMFDLISDFLGALLGGIVSIFIEKKSKRLKVINYKA